MAQLAASLVMAGPLEAVGHRRSKETHVMGLPEVLIVLLGFAIPGTYLFFVNRYIRAAERETAEADANDRKGLRAPA